MAPTRTIKNKHAAGVSKHASSKSGIANSKAASSRSSHNIANVSESGVKKLGRSKGANVKQTKLAADAAAKRKKAREGKGKKTQFTEKELRDMGVPELNGIRPVGVTAPRGKKKGKVFVDDRESMATILALVHAEKDGQIESKMQRARQLEEIREARKVEAEKRKESKKEKLDEKKEELRKKRRRSGGDAEAVEKEEKKAEGAEPKKKKRVSFA